jgi:chromosome segregation ATPase
MESEITKERDGIQLRKYYEETEFEHPSVVYEFESLRVEPVTIHLSENVPKSAEPTDIGFHRDFGSEHWHIEGHTLQFEYEVEGDAEYRTVYAVKPDKQLNAAELMVTPDEFTVDPPAEMVRGGGAQGATGTTGVKNDVSIPSEESGSLPIRENGDRPLEEESSGTTATSRATEEQAAKDDSDSSEPSSSADEEPLLDQLITELERDDTSDETRQKLREQLLGETQPGSVDARIKQLQTELADLRAYTNALETFLDEHGSAEEVINRFEARMDSFEGDMDELENTTAGHESRQESQHEETQVLQEGVESAIAKINSVDEEVAELSSDVEQVQGELDGYDIDSRFEAVESELSEIASLQDNLKQVFQS